MEALVYELAPAIVAGERLLLDPAEAPGGEEVCPCMMGFGFMGGPFGFIFSIFFLILMLAVIAGAAALLVAIARWAFSSMGGGGGSGRQRENELKEELEFLRREVEALRRRLEER